MGKNGNAISAEERVEELVLAGIGLSERKPKKFRKAVQRGRKAEKKSNAYTGVLAQVHARVAGLRSARRRWRLVRGLGPRGVCRQGAGRGCRPQADGRTHPRVRATRRGQRAAPTDVRASGGGWYDLRAHGVLVDRVQGEQEAAPEPRNSPAAQPRSDRGT